MSAAFPTDAEVVTLADELARWVEPTDGEWSDHATATRSILTALAPLIRAREAAAWDEGYDQGHQAARAVNPEWPDQPTNPYQEADNDRH